MRSARMKVQTNGTCVYVFQLVVNITYYTLLTFPTSMAIFEEFPTKMGKRAPGGVGLEEHPRERFLKSYVFENRSRGCS